MKKIFLFSICTLLLVDNVFATCGQSTLGFDGAQKPDHDEFLYINDTQYNLTVSGYDNSNRQSSGSGYGYECDTTRSAGCDKGDEVTLPAGHVFKGKPVPQSVKYICRSGYGFNDHWEAQKGTEDACDTKFGELPVGRMFDGKTTVDCSGISKTEENVNLVKSWAVLCRPGRTVVCKPTECVKDYEVNSKTGKCDFIGNGGGAKTKMCNFDGRKVSLGYCEQSKDCQRATLADTKTGEVCKRCCGENSKGQMENKYLITKCPSGKNGIGFKDAEKTFKPKDIYNGSYRVCEEKKNSCKESRKTEEGKACCDFSAKIAYWDSKTQDCICTDKNASFEKVNGKWQCVPEAGACDSLKSNPEAYACCTAGYKWEYGKCEGCPDGQRWYWNAAQGKGMCIDNGPVVEPTPTTCTETDCKITINQTIRCFNNGNYFNSTENYSVCKEDLDALRLDCNGLKTRVNACQNTDCIRGLLTRIEAFDELIAKVCNSSGAPTPVVVPDNSAKIAAAKQIVSSFFGSAESNKSVWKDAEGNFNTARLASDLTAGVVLGTVGGVVSGVVIKKKQVEKGFDALHCAVGGQTVADWGDTFNVGLRR